MSRLTATAAALLLVGGACTSSTYVSSASPDTSPSQAAAASPSPSPSPSPVEAGPLAITAVPVHNGEIGQAFSPITLAAGGGVPPYSWAIGTGALPTGLTLSAQGVISGSVTKDGGFKFTVAVADSGGHQASKSTAITIYKALKLTATCVNVCVIGRGCAKCGGFGTATGGAGPLAYKVIAGAVPPGMTRNNLSLGGGFPAGNFGLTVQVTDQLGVQGTVKANWSIYDPAKLASGGDCINSANPPSCTIRWTYSGGSPTTAPKLVIAGYSQYCNVVGQCATPSAPPPGWTVSVKSGLITISAGGIPCNSPSYLGTLKLDLVDPAACATTAPSNAVNLAVDLENNC